MEPSVQQTSSVCLESCLGCITRSITSSSIITNIIANLFASIITIIIHMALITSVTAATIVCAGGGDKAERFHMQNSWGVMAQFWKRLEIRL